MLYGENENINASIADIVVKYAEMDFNKIGKVEREDIEEVILENIVRGIMDVLHNGSDCDEKEEKNDIFELINFWVAVFGRDKDKFLEKVRNKVEEIKDEDKKNG